MYANVIVNITHEQIDKPFQYRVPAKLEECIAVGNCVVVPFGKGNREMEGFVIELTSCAEYDPSKIKEILRIDTEKLTIEARMIQLAWWMKQHYGSTMIQALKTVMPVKSVHPVRQKISYRKAVENAVLEDYRKLAEKKNWKARERLAEAFQKQDILTADQLKNEYHATQAVLRPFLEAGLIEQTSEIVYRNPISRKKEGSQTFLLNEEQRNIVTEIKTMLQNKDCTPVLIHGITGSGKTEVYMKLIEEVLETGKQSIVLIPEISLTYQTVSRFYQRFGDRISVVNSKLSQGERSDQFERARKGEIDVMIGPRSALFTPFANLGLIIIDEEQEQAYKSEGTPRYHARETAVKLAEMNQALVVMGSATPTVDSYYHAVKHDYRLLELTRRAVEGSELPEVEIVDLRKEMEEGNRSVFSRSLHKKMEACLQNGEQMMLFLNRRGYSKAVSCRSCGSSIGCPHCDVALTEHSNGRLICHYCGYSIPAPKQCPSCQSPYIAGFGLGTQKIEALTRKAFPQARILRMDRDTTSAKGAMEAILTQFREKKADILIGTQMIVKGHDFPSVTLVGILAADMSLYAGDYKSTERTFQLLTQAAGRAGRGARKGEVVIQTYSPENYGIEAASRQDYRAFYNREIQYRSMMNYPPAGFMCSILVSSRDSEESAVAINRIAALIKSSFYDTIQIIGPTDAGIARIQDFFRKELFLKSGQESALIEAMQKVEQFGRECKTVYIDIDVL